MKPRIYCDMDGVLCDFQNCCSIKVTGILITKWMYASKTEKWQHNQRHTKILAHNAGKWEDNYGLTYLNLNSIFYQHM